MDIEFILTRDYNRGMGGRLQGEAAGKKQSMFMHRESSVS